MCIRDRYEIDVSAGVRGTRSARLSASYLPARAVAGVRVARSIAGTRWSVGLELAGSHLQHAIELPDPYVRSVRVNASLNTIESAAFLRTSLFELGAFALRADARAGYTFGARSLDSPHVRHPSQVFGYPSIGAGVEAWYALTEVIGVFASAHLDLIVLDADGRLRAAPSDLYSFGISLRP